MLSDLAEAVLGETSSARGGVSLSVARVSSIDTTTSPDTYVIGGRRMGLLDDGGLVTEGDLVAVLVVGAHAIGLGSLRDT